MSNITNLPGSTITSITTSGNLATALSRSYMEQQLHSFIIGSQSLSTQYQSAASQFSTVTVEVKPVHTEPTNITTLTEGTELTLGSYNRSNYAGIDVKLDYALADRWVYNSADLMFTDKVTSVNTNAELDHMETSMKVILRAMKRTINGRLRASAAASTYGTSGTALNAAVFRDIRSAATTQGYGNDIIEVRLAPTFFLEAMDIPEFQNILGLIPAAGNNNTQNDSVSPTSFRVGGYFNMTFIQDDTYDRPTPASDPVGSAYTARSAIVPVRGLPVVDPTQDFPTFFEGINMLYQMDHRKINIGRGVAASLETVYGFKELTADINSAGAIQTTPIYNILGGKV
jgi:hypothetical protein